jgi:hypothetical protein
MAAHLGHGIKDDVPTGWTPRKRQWPALDESDGEEEADESEARDQLSEVDTETGGAFSFPLPPGNGSAANAVACQPAATTAPLNVLNKARRTTTGTGRIGVLGEKNPNVTAAGAGTLVPLPARKEKKERQSIRPPVVHHHA